MAQECDGSWFALGYLRCKSHGQHQQLEGLEVQVDEAPARVVGIPFASRSFPARAVAAANKPVAVPRVPASVAG